MQSCDGHGVHNCPPHACKPIRSHFQLRIRHRISLPSSPRKEHCRGNVIWTTGLRKNPSVPDLEKALQRHGSLAAILYMCYSRMHMAAMQPCTKPSCFHHSQEGIDMQNSKDQQCWRRWRAGPPALAIPKPPRGYDGTDFRITVPQRQSQSHIVFQPRHAMRDT